MNLKSRIEKLDRALQGEAPVDIKVTTLIFDRLQDGKLYYTHRINRETGEWEPIDPPIPVSKEELTKHRG